MAIKSQKQNRVLIETIEVLGSLDSDLWKRVAKDLAKTSQNKRVVNISRINRFSEQNELIVVPGKVLGAGRMDHAVTVGAFAFSDSAKKAIEESKGKAVPITELAKQAPKGTGVKLLG